MSGLLKYKRVIPVGQASDITARGNLIVMRQCQGTVNLTNIQNSLSDKSGESFNIDMRVGEKWRTPKDFDGVRLTNTDNIDQTVTIFVGYGDYVFPPPNVDVADTLATAAPAIVGVPALIRASNPQRYRVTFRNTSDDLNLKIGGEASQDYTIPPQGTFTLITRAEVWGFYDTAVSEIPVEWIEEAYNEAS